MIVASDDRWPDGTGIGIVQQELVSRVPPGTSVRPLGVKTPIGSVVSPWAVGRALARTPADVFWSAGFVPAVPCRVPAVLTVHDLTHLHYYSKLHVVYMNAIYRPLFRRATTILCVSGYTRRELLDWAGLDPARVHVVWNGVSEAFRPSVDEVAEPYVLYPGNRRPYKNLERLLSAFAASRLPASGISLRLTGRPDPALLARARSLGCSEAVSFTGHLDADALATTYRRSLGVAFVSLYEGFGLPIVEGMASGVPVLTSNVSAMPEVAGGAAIVVDPFDVDAITAGLEQLVFDSAERSRCIREGLARAQQFDWDESARTTWRLVGEAAARGRRTDA